VFLKIGWKLQYQSGRSIGAEPGAHLVLAYEPEIIAKEILKLFAEPDRAAAIGKAARKFVE